MSLLYNNQNFQDNMRGNFKGIDDNPPYSEGCTKHSDKMFSQAL